MKSKSLLKGICGLFFGAFLMTTSVYAQDSGNKEGSNSLGVDVEAGKSYFEGSERFSNGGPACITCHNITNDRLIPGGLLAKDLSETNGVTASTFAQSLPNQPMKVSYGEKPLTKNELKQLTAFFDYTSENYATQKVDNGYWLFYAGGGIGVIVLLLLISVIWMKRKKEMVKEDIFARQNSAWDAKY